MAILSLCSTSAPSISLYTTTKYKLAAASPPRRQQLPVRAKLSGTVPSSSLLYNPLRISIKQNDNASMAMRKKSSKRVAPVCYVGSASRLSVHSVQWISTICTAILLFSKGTAIQKAFLVPLFILQAPSNIISFIKGEYGVWTAFLALLVRLFFYMPGELELPLVALLLTIVAPYQVMSLRGRQEGSIIALVLAGYLAFQHFSRTGSLKNSFEQGAIVATLAVICIIAVSCFLLF